MEATITEKQERAQALYDALERVERDSGAQFVRIREGAPAWVQPLCMEAHNGMFPDDYKYEYIEDAAEALANADDWDDADQNIESDPYTSDLSAWLASNITRYMYCDEFADEFGMPKDEGGRFCDTVKLIAGGQYMERREVFAIVRRELERIADES